MRLVVADCDGVLTDGGVYHADGGEELRRFSARDGMGFTLLRDAGISLAIISAEIAPSIARRATMLSARAMLGIKDKASYLETVLDEMELTAAETAYIGDDLDDVAVMRAIAEHGLVGAPSDAVPEVQRVAHHVAAWPGGRGAFRDFAEWILGPRAA